MIHNAGKTCAVPGCDSKFHCKGFCKKHYLRNLRYGSPTGGRRFDGEVIAFLKALVGTTELECILWPYGLQKNGYGSAIRYGSVSNGPHRIMCILAHGDPPNQQYQAAHACHNSACVNPNHLRWATPLENTQDRVLANRCAKGERQHLARITASQVLEIRNCSGRTLELARRFGVHRTTIQRARKKSTWGHIDGSN